jgi:tRNA-splicing ligase RtcB
MSSAQLLPVEGGVPVHAWVSGVPFEEGARQQVERTARLPFVQPHVAIMPDVHFGRGATVGSVIPTVAAIVPAAVGVDIGCGMAAVRTSLRADQLPDSLFRVRAEIEKVVPVGRGDHERPNAGMRTGGLPELAGEAWGELKEGYRAILREHPRASHARPDVQIGTLGGGNHFIEICLDEAGSVWIMLHSGSRGAGNVIGTYFTQLARDRIREKGVELEDLDLAWLEEGSPSFDAYWRALSWAQDYARANREVMLAHTLKALRKSGLPRFTVDETAVNCHHNYVAREQHYGLDVFVTRKGAVRAGEGEMGIIPGSMGAKSYIVRGRGNAESFCSCSHGAGRAMSRGEATRRFTLADHRAATSGIECRKDKDVIDETPGAYKDIDAVMAAQSDLVEVVHTLKQVVCVKG